MRERYRYETPNLQTLQPIENQMQSLLNASIIILVGSTFAFIAFDFVVNLKALWNKSNPQEIASPKIEVTANTLIETEPEQAKLTDIWDEIQDTPVLSALQPAPTTFQLLLSPAKETVAPTPAKKRGRPKKSTMATTMPTAEAELAATFCQPTQVQVAPKKRGRPKKAA